MTRILPSPWLILGLLAALALAGAQGWRMGAASAEARHRAALEAVQRDLHRTADELSRRAAEVETDRAARRAIALEIEDEARNDLDGRRPGIGPDGLRRIERRWAAP